MAVRTLLLFSGVICLLISAYALYRMIPREGRAAWSWMKTDSGETIVALGQFSLMIAGFALIAKAVF